MALAVAMLVIVMLSGIGAVAVSSATYDVASAGATRQASNAESVAEGGLALTRCEMCDGLDGLVLAMQSMRHKQGNAPQFKLDHGNLQAALPTGTTIFADPDPTLGRGSLGGIYDSADPSLRPTMEMEISIDRPRESRTIAGYSLREAVGSDSASFCFRYYQVTAEGTFIPTGGTKATHGNRAQQRAYVTAGPIECSN
jgi:hypothetical protein